VLKGKKTVLTAVKRDSLEQLMNWRNEPELRKYFREYREINEHMQQSWYENRVLKDPNQVNFEIREKEGNELIGHCGLYYIDWVSRHAEFGIYVGDQNYRNGGYGSDSLRTLIKYGFQDLNLNKIWCEVYANNNALGVYERLGFVLEGVQRQHYFNEGKYWDSRILSLLKTEWENNE
jgi:UDP-4-amino-4,6-dideoxy-N-acetyl-beta-L-altrosamine N-acetyltransferase